MCVAGLVDKARAALRGEHGAGGHALPAAAAASARAARRCAPAPPTRRYVHAPALALVTPPLLVGSVH